LLDDAEPVTRPRISAADVDAIEAITDGFRHSGYAHGGGLCRVAAVAQLQQVRRLSDAICSPEVRDRLLVATAELAHVTGSLAYDVEQHDSARQLWTFALDTTRRAAPFSSKPEVAELREHVRIALTMAA
jgi:hypothetical protein